MLSRLQNDTDHLRIGVLGCGQIAQAAHFEAVRKAQNASLYAICDVAEDLLRRMAVQHEPNKTFTSYEQMLSDDDIDAVVVAIADQFHVDATLRALDAGKHVLVEKPLGVSIEECKLVAEKADNTGLIVQVGSMKRFDPGITQARAFINSAIGEVLALKAWYCDSTYRYSMTDTLQPLFAENRDAKRPAGDPKLDKRRYFLLGHGSHLVDTARFLGGDLVSVHARLVEKFGAYSWFVDTEFESGANGHLDLTIAVRMDWHEGFQVYGEHGSVIGKTYNPWYLRSSDVECFSSADGSYRRILGEDAHFYRLQVEAFADRIHHGVDSGAATAQDGLAAVQALVAIARSAKTGVRVRLDSVAGGP
ncbi:Gfo/Idh/MocA family oxidoreductase [soil metagenome]